MADRRLVLSLAVSMIAWLGPMPVSSQGTPPGKRDSTAARRRDSTAVRLAPVAVRASIVPAAGIAVGSGVPARITTVARDEFHPLGPATLADALAAQPGVSVYDDLGSPYKSTLVTRGFAVSPTVGLPAAVTVFLDGVRQNEPDAQEVNFDLLPMDHVERVELLSGAASLLGPNSLGGAVNLVTERGSGPPRGSVELAGGSFDALSLRGSFSGGASDGWDYYAGGGAERTDGWRAQSNARRFNGFLNLGRGTATRGISVQAYGARSRARTAGSLPESIFRVAPRTNFTPGDDDDLNAQQLSVSAHAPLGGVRGSITAYVRHSGAERFNVNQPPDDDVRSVTANWTFGATADVRRIVAVPHGELALRAGVDGAASRVRVRIFAEPGSGGRDSLTTDVRSPSWDLAAYALADATFGRVTVSTGARYDGVRIPFTNAVDPAGDTTNTYSWLSPRGGVSVDVGGGAALYASIGRSFRAPAILELGCADPEASCPLPFALGEDPPLRPVTATAYEAGARWARGALLVNGSVYRTAVRDEIFFIASDVARLSGYFTNVPRTRREGAELTAHVSSLGGRLAADVSYAYTRATFRTAAEIFSIRADDAFAESPLAGPNTISAGDRLPLVPDHQAKVGATARLPRGIELRVDTRRIGRQWLRGDEANETRPLDPYTVANASLLVRQRGWEIVAAVTNALDTRRATFGTFNENRRTGALERFLTPVTGRAVRLSLQRSIGGPE